MDVFVCVCRQLAKAIFADIFRIVSCAIKKEKEKEKKKQKEKKRVLFYLINMLVKERRVFFLSFFFFFSFSCVAETENGNKGVGCNFESDEAGLDVSSGD